MRSGEPTEAPDNELDDHPGNAGQEDVVWELICHHTYKWHGVAADLSFYESHGVTQGLSSSDFLQDGAAPGSGE